MSAYPLSFGGLLLLGGRTADLLGRRRVFMTGTLLFGLSSVLCGFAWTAGILVAARVVQGVSAAVMAPTALSILLNTFEEGHERNKALAIWSGSGGLGAAAALLAFTACLVLAAVGVACALVFLRGPRRQPPPVPEPVVTRRRVRS